MSLLFVYGSLKEGFPNFHVNAGRRVAGEYQTSQAFPLYLYRGQLPCLLATPGSGHRVRGQVFAVTPAALAAMDEFERVGQPGGYRRIAIDVVALGQPGSAAFSAFAYVQDPALFAAPGEHVGPLSEYTTEHARRLRW